MRKLMKPLLLSVGLFVCPALAICQQPVPATLSLADAIAIARQHNPAYRQTIHDRAPAAWGVRNAWSSLWLPSVTASGGVGYAGPGEQNFLTSSFSQSVSTWSSSYSLLLDWTLNGQTLSQPGLKKAQLNAAQADVVGAETNLVTAVTQQYLTVLQARDNAEVARQQLDHDEQFLKLAQARYEVGRASLIDVRQAQVARGVRRLGQRSRAVHRGCGGHTRADRPRPQRPDVGLGGVRLQDVQRVRGGGGAGAHDAQVVSPLSGAPGDTGATAGGGGRADGVGVVPRVARQAGQRGRALPPDRGPLCRAVSGPRQLQAGERPVRARGGERGVARDGAPLQCAHPVHRPGGSLWR